MTLPHLSHSPNAKTAFAGFIRLFATLALALSSLIANATSVTFDIPAQSAPAALKLFEKQSGRQAIFIYDDLKEVRTKAVHGSLEALAALEMLFTGTGFEVTQSTSKAFVIGKAGQQLGAVRGTLMGEGGRGLPNVLVAIRETAQSTETDKHGQYVFPKVAPGTYVLVATASGYQPLHIIDVAVKAGRELLLGKEEMRKATEGPLALAPFVVHADTVEQLEKYEVVGTKQKAFTSANLDIPRTINDAQPYYIFDAKTIDSSGARNVEDFLKQRLTMNTLVQANGDVSNLQPLGNTSSINLRGVGTDKTLILVDGRRLAGVNFSNSGGSKDYQPDLNGIPLSAIDRIEVLPSSASGIYGGSAIGGVVNVILKRDYAGGELRLNYDNTWDSDTPRRNASLSYGLALEGGKTHLSLNASWSDQQPMMLQDRANIFRDNMKLILSRSPAFITSTWGTWLGSLPNIAPNASAVTTLTLKPAYGGTVLNSRNTHVPAGTAPGISTAQLASLLLANAGQWNMDLPASTQTINGLRRLFGSPAQTRSIQAGLRRQMSPWLELSANLSWSENRTSSIFNPVNIGLIVPAAAPTNPFTVDVSVRVPDAGEFRTTTNSQSRSAMLGTLLKLPWSWTGALDYTWSESRFESFNYTHDTAGENAALANGTLNPFVDTLLHPLDLKRFIAPVSFKGSNRQDAMSLRGSGPLPSLPWGQPNLTVGLERRIATTPERTHVTDYPVTVGNSVRYKFYKNESTTDSGYLEAAVPLVKEQWVPGLHSLEAQLSGRSERYAVDAGTPGESTSFRRNPPTRFYLAPTLSGQPYYTKATYTSTNQTVGLKYQPVKDVTLRISQATAFLPPEPAQLVKNPEQTPYQIPVIDPKTGQMTFVYSYTGGNPNLKPQHSKSLNAGVIWAPAWKPLQGLRLNAEYYKIDQFDYISQLPQQLIVDQEASFPDRVIRDSTGRITHVDVSLANLYYRRTEGWDLSADYTRQTSVGRFNLHVVESIILHLKNQYSRTLPPEDTVNFPSEGGAAKYKGNATLNWDWRHWTAGWTTRYTGAYKQYGAAGGPYAQKTPTGSGRTLYILPQAGDTIPVQIYHDVFVGYAFGGRAGVKPDSRLRAVGASLLDDLTLQLGVRNVFDTIPPLDAYYAGNNYFSPYGDLRLRSYWLSLRKSF
jgi:iron complex outermembrane receptor protein